MRPCSNSAWPRWARSTSSWSPREHCRTRRPARRIRRSRCEFNTNATAVIALLTRIANALEAQRSGALAVISSVAADRGRPSNYLYGSAKAALSAFCEGLNARLFKAGVHVLTIKPGFVSTPMTAGLPLPGPLVASPEKVSRDIVRAIDKRKDTLYTPWFWAIIMLIIRSVPKPVFKRTSL